ncbi:hypothetical protein KO516_10915 [Citreicella sp. C3M06]|uniref:helix-turn-helix domain-containing protein n=1 Tax=Citreicella sp. C3M06 TaxID=2841564 RepID=UPI001C09BA28|nr:hypothetical protein [Citreicella sp. C3M06]MBU2961319.1 hypothetical protein [Citreicella sp. C3M06]
MDGVCHANLGNRQLSVKEPVQIERWKLVKIHVREMAGVLQRSKATSHREIKRNWIAPPGRTLVRKLEAQGDFSESVLPSGVMDFCRPPQESIYSLDTKIRETQKRLKDAAKSDPAAIRLQTAPETVPLGAMATLAGPDWPADVVLPSGCALPKRHRRDRQPAGAPLASKAA